MFETMLQKSANQMAASQRLLVLRRGESELYSHARTLNPSLIGHFIKYSRTNELANQMAASQCFQLTACGKDNLSERGC